MTSTPSKAAAQTDRETRPQLLRRLLGQAAAGVESPVGEVDALEFRRDQYGLTRTEFAQVLGMSPSHFSEVMSGHRRLPAHAIARAVAIGVPVAPLLAGRTARQVPPRATTQDTPQNQQESITP